MSQMVVKEVLKALVVNPGGGLEHRVRCRMHPQDNEVLTLQHTP